MAGTVTADPLQLMYCTLKNGAKAVSVALDGDHVTYAYGSLNKAPDLALRTSVAEVDYRPWPGIGSSIWEEFVFTNGSYGYDVTMGFEKDPDSNSGFGGISVTNNGTEIAYLDCDPGSVEMSYGIELVDAKRAEGLCWDLGPQRGWKACS